MRDSLWNFNFIIGNCGCCADSYFKEDKEFYKKKEFVKTHTNKSSLPGAAFVVPKTNEAEVMRHGQSAGQENRAGERNVPAGAEVG